MNVSIESDDRNDVDYCQHYCDDFIDVVIHTLHFHFLRNDVHFLSIVVGKQHVISGSQVNEIKA